MKHLRTILSSTLFVLSLATLPANSAQARFSIEISSGYSHNVHRGHQRRPGLGVHAGHRRHPGFDVHAGHRRHPGNHRRYRRAFHHAAPRHRRHHGRHHGNCQVIVTHNYDHYGREIVVREKLCSDRFGRRFVYR